MRRTLILVALIALTPVPPAAATEWVRSVSGAQARAKAKKQMIFVDLFAQWCGWCHKFEADVVPTPEFKKVTADMVLLRVDTEDRGEGTKLAQRYQVSTLPTFLVLNADMSIVGVIRGYAPAPRFAKILEETVSKNKLFQKTVKEESTFTKDYPKRLEIGREFLARQAWPESESRFRKLTTEKGVPLAFRDEAFYQLAMVFLMQGKYEDTLKTINEFGMIQKEGEYFERSTLLRGDVFLQQGKIAAAFEVLKDFKDRFPNSQYIPSVNSTLPLIEQRLKTQ